jgi:endonuclease/exonuclease/phosphatase family metal-dependent hydrolase
MKSKTRKLSRKKQITNSKSGRQQHKQTRKSLQKAHKSINVIAYNVSWESMTGKKPEWALCSNSTDPTHPRHHSVCVGNVATVLEDNPADFILLQEADGHNNLIKESSRLSKMEYEFHESSKDKMITFWNKKYTMKKIIRDEFEPGRPWMAILYTNGWCVVNVHFGHYFRYQEINKLNQLIKKIKKEFGGKVPGQNEYNRIIIGGDFNYDIKQLGRDGKIVIDGVIFHYHPKNLLTCCINRRVQNDHVIDTHSPLLDIKIPAVAYMASDHKPVLATLQ